MEFFKGERIINSGQLQAPMVPTDAGFYKDLLDHIGNGVYFVDLERRILFWNEGAYRLTGYKAEDLLGKHCQDDILCHVDYSGTNLCQKGCPLTESIADGKVHEAKVFLRHKLGRRVPVSLRVQPMRAMDGTIIGAIEIFSNNSAEIEAQRKMEAMDRLAFLDDLTQLPNRRFLEMSLETAISEYRVHKNSLGVLVMDLDHFKAINDTFGHSFGDHALQEVGNTLLGSLRPTDIVGRWGGDEFLTIAHNVDHEILSTLAQRCVAMIAQTSIPNNDGNSISLSLSVGAALSQPGETAQELFQRADKLMYRSKAEGRNRVTMDIA
jgi:diguanylate cyclase (GGDEF)-like protein/PAS domain S-box-containing protein